MLQIHLPASECLNSQSDHKQKCIASLTHFHFLRYREDNNWTLERRRQRDKHQLRLVCRNHVSQSHLDQSGLNPTVVLNKVHFWFLFVKLREARLNVVLSDTLLLPLSRILDECCSEDETDTEASTSGKVCKVRCFWWQSAALEEILIFIDEHRVKSNDASPVGTPGPSARQRVRSWRNPFSDKDAPEGLPIDCYDHGWLYDLNPQKERAEVLKQRPLTWIKNVLMEL